MRKTRRRTRIANINVIPYLDVMLVLLVIFMATAPLFNLSEVKPAEVAAEAASAGAGGLLVSYPLGEPISITNPTTGEETLLFDEDEVVRRVNTECILNPGRPLALVGDKEQSHEKVMGLYSRIVSETECDPEKVGLGVRQK